MKKFTNLAMIKPHPVLSASSPEGLEVQQISSE